MEGVLIFLIWLLESFIIYFLFGKKRWFLLLVWIKIICWFCYLVKVCLFFIKKFIDISCLLLLMIVLMIFYVIGEK